MTKLYEGPMRSDANCVKKAKAARSAVAAGPSFVSDGHRSKILIDFTEFWNHRELLYFLIWRDVKIRYKQTILGAAWAIIQPVVIMLIFTLIFGKVAKIDSGEIPYPVFVYAGIFPWSFFANAVHSSGNSIIGSAHLITKVYFPRVIIPVAAVCVGLVDLAVAVPVLAVLMFYYRIGLTLSVLFLIPLVLMTTLLTMGVGIWLSAVTTNYRDVKFMVPFLVQVWMYLSPVAYPSSVVPLKWKFLYSLNPFVGLLDGYRAAAFGQTFDWGSIVISFGFTLLFLIIALNQFRKMERRFADVV